MSSSKNFVIAIGGTGMRCLESFVHLCAMGMFDNKEIEVLTLDTDQFNGNKARVESLIETYNLIKSPAGNKNGGNPNTDTFFSAKLNLHRYWTTYTGSGRNNFRAISKINESNQQLKEENSLIADLLLERESVQEFDLAHGYRAQTHLGSHLMYHGIVEAARSIASGQNVKPEEKELEDFINKMSVAENGRVFIFGSVFGGTGASSIPVLPLAFKDAVDIRSGGKSTIDLDKLKFGSTLLTEYFAFKKPDAAQMKTKDDSVIADSSFFALNSQAALQFYQNDPTVRRVYKRMYHIGWPIESKPYGEKKDTETITGGATQKNPAHVLELMCATAAFDFFTVDDNILNTKKAEYVYRSAMFENGVFSFNGADFVGSDLGDKFVNKIGAFLSFAHIALSLNEGASNKLGGVKTFLKTLKEQNVDAYNSLTNEEMDQIDEYLKLFCYYYDSQNNFTTGWIYQVRSTIAPGAFLFDSSAFSTDRKELSKIDVGKIFKDEKNHWDSSLFSSSYNGFVKGFVDSGKPDAERQKVNTTKEKFLAHIYNGITIAQKFEK